MDILHTALPESTEVQEKLDYKEVILHKKKLQKEWSDRKIQVFDEKDIKELNLAFQSQETEEELNKTARGFEGQQTVDSRSWILKSGSKWLGYDPQSQSYFKDPIFYGGDIDFPRNFESLVINDSQSGSINLIWTVRNILDKGVSMGLTDEDWIQVYLLLAKKHLPLAFPSLSRHSCNLNALFLELVSNINLENELARLRAALCGISRKVSEQIHISVFRIKSLYQMVLSISCHHFSEDKLQTLFCHRVGKRPPNCKLVLII